MDHGIDRGGALRYNFYAVFFRSLRQACKHNTVMSHHSCYHNFLNSHPGKDLFQVCVVEGVSIRLHDNGCIRSFTADLIRNLITRCSFNKERHTGIHRECMLDQDDRNIFLFGCPHGFHNVGHGFFHIPERIPAACTIFILSIYNNQRFFHFSFLLFHFLCRQDYQAAWQCRNNHE